MQKRTIFLATLGLLLSLQGTRAAAATEADDIREATRLFLQQWADEQSSRNIRIEFEVGHIDSRVSLADCPGELETSFSADPMRSTRPSVLVACSGNRPWRMYVTADLDIFGPGLVAARPLARGELLQDSLLKVSEVQLNSSYKGVLTDREQITGMILRRPVKAGTLITPDLLEAPDAIERGDHVIIVARSESFSVQSRGKALANASVGDQVLIENLSSARTVRARVIAPGRVEIPM